MKSLSKLLVVCMTSLLVFSFIPMMSYIIAKTNAQDEPRYGGNLRVGIGSVGNLNPVVGTPIFEHWQAVTPVYDTLVRFPNDWPSTDFLPNLAESWEQSTDGKSLTLHLVHNATFHDGHAFTAHDAVYSITESHKRVPFMYFWKHELTITEVDDYTIRLTFDKAVDVTNMLIGLAYHGWVFPAHLYEGTDFDTNPYNLKPIGTGPFKFVEFSSGSHIIYERNPNYWRKGLPYLDQVIIKIMPDQAARIRAIETGELDYNPIDVSYSELVRVIKEGKLEVEFYSAHATVYPLHMNLDNPILQIKKVRYAINYALDKEAILLRVTYGLDDYSGSWMHPIQAAWKQQPMYDYNPELAKQLLDEAGYPVGTDGKRFTLDFVVNRDYGFLLKAGELMKEYLEDVGIGVNFRILDKITAMTDVNIQRNFDLGLPGGLSMGPSECKIIQNMASWMIGKSSGNPSGYNNTYVDSLCEQVIYQTNWEDQKAILQELQDIIANESFQIPFVQGIKKHVHNGEFVGIPKKYTNAIHSGGASIAEVYWIGGEASETVSDIPIEIIGGVIIIVVAVAAVVAFVAFKKRSKS